VIKVKERGNMLNPYITKVDLGFNNVTKPVTTYPISAASGVKNFSAVKDLDLGFKPQSFPDFSSAFSGGSQTSAPAAPPEPSTRPYIWAYNK
jgi:hypothetical protein